MYRSQYLESDYRSIPGISAISARLHSSMYRRENYLEEREREREGG